MEERADATERRESAEETDKRNDRGGKADEGKVRKREMDKRKRQGQQREKAVSNG